MDMIKKIRVMHRLLPLLFSAMVLLLPACENDNNNNSPIDTGDDETTITFSVDIPKEFTPSTYGLTGTQEDYLNTVDVLIFNGNTFISGPHYGIIDETNKKVSVRIPSTNGTFTMAVFGNCRSTLNKTFSGVKETIYSGLTISEPSKWLATTTGDNVPTKPIPMWGEASVKVENGIVSGTISVSLIRMLARINVANKTTAGVFTITSIDLYNHNTSGRIAPKVGDTNVWDSTNKIAKLPSTSTGRTKGPISYSPASGVSGPTGTYNNEIYTFEADKGTDASPANNPCLVIGGTYGGSTYYYRIDLAKANATTGVLTYYDLLRNHSYNVDITDIKGPGASSSINAFNSAPVNIQYLVTEWDDSDITQIVTNGTTLGVSQGEFNFTKGAANATLTVNTNNAEGWTAKVFDSNGTTDQTNNSSFWLQINSTSGNSGNTDVVLNVTANGGSTRTAFIEITAGTIVYTVKVVQSDSDISLLIDNLASNKTVTLVAPVGQSAAKSFTLSWAPATSPVYYSGSGSISNFTFGGSSISGGQVLSSNGQKVIEVQSPTFSGGTPTLSTPLVDGATASVSYLLYGLSRTVTLKQQVWDMFVTDGTSTITSINKTSPLSATPFESDVKLFYPANTTITHSSTDGSGATISGTAPNFKIATSTPYLSASTPSVTTTDNNIKFTARYAEKDVPKTITFTHEIWDLFVNGSNAATSTLTAPTIPIGDTPEQQPVTINTTSSATMTSPAVSGIVGSPSGSNGSWTYPINPLAGTASPAVSISSSTMLGSRTTPIVFKAKYKDVESPAKTLSLVQNFWDINLTPTDLNFEADQDATVGGKNVTLKAPIGSKVTWSVKSKSGDGNSDIANVGYFGLPIGQSDPTTAVSQSPTITPSAQSTVGTLYATLECKVEYEGKTIVKELDITQKTNDLIVNEQPKANSYIVSSVGNPIISIPIEQAYDAIDKAPSEAALPSGWFDPSGSFVSELVWKDNNLIAFNSSIIGSGRAAYIRLEITSSGQEGNVVIGIRNKNAETGNAEGGFLWSWHIWVMSGNPWTGTPTTGTFMDRNLGALRNSWASKNGTTAGLLYQWGRKDPFPGTADYTSNSTDGSEPDIYFGSSSYSSAGNNATGKLKIVAIGGTSTYTPPSGASQNLGYAVANPHIFYTNSASPYDWYTTSTQNHALWGASDGSTDAHESDKTVYDPCPPGWRVPSLYRWVTALGTTANSVSQGSTPGWSWNSDQRGYNVAASGTWVTAAVANSHWPATGRRHPYTGALEYVGTLGYYWSGSPNDINGRRFNFNSSTVYSPVDNWSNRSGGISIRCAKE